MFEPLPPQIESSMRGTTLTLVQDKPAMLISSHGFTTGVHTWEILCPISCAGLKFGIAKDADHVNVFEFKTTTPRIITIVLNLILKSLSFYLNGNLHGSKGAEKLEESSWHLCVCLANKGNQVTVLSYKESLPQLQSSPLKLLPIEINKVHTHQDFEIFNGNQIVFEDGMIKSTRNSRIGYQVLTTQEHAFLYNKYPWNDSQESLHKDYVKVEQEGSNIYLKLQGHEKTLLQMISYLKRQIPEQEITKNLQEQDPLYKQIEQHIGIQSNQEIQEIVQEQTMPSIVKDQLLLVIALLLDQLKIEVPIEQSAYWRLKEFADHRSGLDAIEACQNTILLPGVGVTLKKVQQTRLCLSSEIKGQGQRVKGFSKRFLSLREGPIVSIINAEAELFQVGEINLCQIGPKRKHVKIVQEEQVSEIYKILENYLQLEEKEEDKRLETLLNMGFDAKMAINALQSMTLDEAVDFLSSCPKEWCCPVCTLVNYGKVCEACETPKPDEDKKIVQELPIIEKVVEGGISQEHQNIITNTVPELVLQVEYQNLFFLSTHGNVLSINQLTPDKESIQVDILDAQVELTLAPLYGINKCKYQFQVYEHIVAEMGKIIDLDFVVNNNDIQILILKPNSLEVFSLKVEPLLLVPIVSIPIEGIHLKGNKITTSDNSVLEYSNLQLKPYIESPQIEKFRFQSIIGHEETINIPISSQMTVIVEADSQVEFQVPHYCNYIVDQPERLDLVIESYEGSQFSQQTPVSAILFEKGIYTSNYKNTRFVFRSQLAEDMLISHIIVKSDLTNQQRGFPIGEGLFFTSNTPEFLNAHLYNDYNFTRTYSHDEPVGYFNMGDQEQVTCHFDVIRPCKYILLKPTNFRSLPFDQTPHFQKNPIEIKQIIPYGKLTPQNDSDIRLILRPCPLEKKFRSIFNVGECYVKKLENNVYQISAQIQGQLTIKDVLYVNIYGEAQSQIKVSIDDLYHPDSQIRSKAMKNISDLSELNLYKFLIVNVLPNELHQPLVQFLQLIQSQPDYQTNLLKTAEAILAKIEKLVITESGLETFLSLLSGLKDTKKVAELASYTLLRSLEKLRTISKDSTYLFSNKNTEDLKDGIKVIECRKDPLSMIAVHINQNHIEHFQIELLGEFELKKVSFRFPQLNFAVRFRIQIQAGDQYIDRQYDDWMFLQMSQYTYSENRPHILCIPLNTRTRTAKVWITCEKKLDQLIFPEFYGEVSDSKVVPSSNRSFKFRGTRLIGERLYYIYENEEKTLYDSYNIVSQPIPEHSVINQKKNAHFLEQAITQLQQEYNAKKAVNLPCEHVKVLIEQSQKQLMRISQPRNYEDNYNFHYSLSLSLLQLLSKNQNTSQELQLANAIIQLGQSGQLTTEGLKYISKHLSKSMQWSQFVIQCYTKINDPFMQRCLSHFQIPIYESLLKLESTDSDFLFDLINSKPLPKFDLMAPENPQNQQNLNLALTYLCRDPKFRVNLVIKLIQQCTATQIKQILTEELFAKLSIRGFKEQVKFKNLLDVIFQPRILSPQYNEWSGLHLLADDQKLKVKEEKEALLWIEKFVLYYFQNYLQNNVENLPLDELLFLFDFLSYGVSKMHKVRSPEKRQAKQGFDDYLQRQNLNICSESSMEHIITLLHNATPQTWSKVLRVITIMNINIYREVLNNYKDHNLFQELLKFTLTITQGQSTDSCSEVIEVLLDFIKEEHAQHILIVLSQKLFNVRIKCAQKLLQHIEIDTDSYSQLELTKGLLDLLLQSERIVKSLTPIQLLDILQWYAQNYEAGHHNSPVGELILSICESIDSLLEMHLDYQVLFKNHQNIISTLKQQVYNGQFSQHQAFIKAQTACNFIVKKLELIEDHQALELATEDNFKYLLSQMSESKITELRKEEELAAKIKLINTQGQNLQTVQDYSLNKKGVKSRIALIPLEGPRSDYNLIFQLPYRTEFRTCRIAFQTFTTDFTDKMLGTPSHISIELGDSIEGLVQVASMSLIPDEFFTQHQVKVFSWTPKQLYTAQYISFRLRAPQLQIIDGITTLTGKSFNKLHLGLNFISITGHEFVTDDIISPLLAKTSVEILAKLCRSQFNQTLQSFSQLSQVNELREQFPKILKQAAKLQSLILSLCRHNSIKDWVIQQLLQGSEQHARLLLEIILAEDQSNRILQVFNYLIPQLMALRSNSKDAITFTQLIPFLEALISAIHLNAKNSIEKQRIHSLPLTKDDLVHLISLYDIFLSPVLIKLISTLTYLPFPYQQVEQIDQVLTYASDMADLHPHYLSLLAPLAIQSPQWAKLSVVKVCEKLVQALQDHEAKQIRIRHQIKYIAALMSQTQEEVKDYIMQLYSGLFDKYLKPIAEDSIQGFTAVFTQHLHKFKNEQFISQLIKDIELNDIRFVQKLLVPILNSQEEMRICVHFKHEGKYVQEKQLVGPKQQEAEQLQKTINSSLLSTQEANLLLAQTKGSLDRLLLQKSDSDPSVLQLLEERILVGEFYLVLQYYRAGQQGTLIIGNKNEVQKIKRINKDVYYECQGEFLLIFNDRVENLRLKMSLDIYDGQGTLQFEQDERTFLMIEYVDGEQSKIDLSIFGEKKAPRICVDSLQIEYFIPAVVIAKKKQYFMQPIAEVSIDKRFTQIDRVYSYLRATPVYRVPVQQLGEVVDSIVDIDQDTKVDLTQSDRKLFAIFESLQGVQKIIKNVRNSISNWANKDKSKTWLQFIDELHSFCHLPSFFEKFMKNELCVSLLFDLLTGSPDLPNQKRKWEEDEQNAVKFIYSTLISVFATQNSSEVRRIALEEKLLVHILDRIALVSKESKRVKGQVIEPVKSVSPPKKTNPLKKKGIGYASDNTGQNSKWNTAEYVERKTVRSQQLISLLGIIEGFFQFSETLPKSVIEVLINTIYESALLPLLESAFRSGSLLEISKEFDLYSQYLKIVKGFAKHPQLAPLFLKVPDTYVPIQTQSLQEVLTVLQENAQIFLSCMNNRQDESLLIAQQIIEAYQLMEKNINRFIDGDEPNLEMDQQSIQQAADNLMKEILNKPLPESYRLLLQDLRFDYHEMKQNGKYKHHYYSSITNNNTPSQAKIVRLAQEFADMSTSLPIEHTNSIFVRADRERVDVLKALIMGAKGTPYAHGAFLFDIFADDNYPNGPPKMNLVTTGNAKVRFNPNLYSCGKVCLSLLGTWRGNASENWDPKLSTLLQVLVSTQAIIMSEEVYFNEPGFEQEAGTEEGDKKNEAYSNIVRFCNVKYAMIDQIRDPPKGFESIIRRHFYLKQHEILEECNKWIELADQKEALYIGLISDHNASWCSEFKKTKKQYHKRLVEAVKELEEELKKLKPPGSEDLQNTRILKTHIKQQVKNIKDGMANLDEIDITYDKVQDQKELSILDESVIDRWSRYIGAMGMDAVKKQSNSSVFISGMGALGVEIAKNIILSGVKEITIHDEHNTTWYDLTGQFFLSEEDIGNNRATSMLHKLQQLNNYVRVRCNSDALPSNQQTISDQFPNLTQYQIVILAVSYPTQTIIEWSRYCRQHKIKFMLTSVDGVFGRLISDFGQFTVEDKNGESVNELVIKNISNSDPARVELLGKHEFEDNDVVYLDHIVGMEQLNKTFQKVKIVSKSEILLLVDSTAFSPYVRNGTIKLVKVPIELKYTSVEEQFSNPTFDQTMNQQDFLKVTHAEQLHKLYNGIQNVELNELFQYSRTIGEFPPLAAFLGGFVAQEIIKGLTNKFMPVFQTFYTDCIEVLPKELPKESQPESRSVERFFGKQLSDQIEQAKVFMIGCGAIGCELLKNFAMINLSVNGSLTITDPDHIETSNLNRQFLFREKHIRKPKSQTAAAVISHMNPLLKNKIIARLDKVHEGTENIYSEQFFEQLTIVANALDNVAARRYVDSRCVAAKVPLLESGTLGPKGHVQCIIPFKTESYGTSNDPQEEGEIPYCTLKMFPEECFHCVEFARDKFSKLFSIRPKMIAKLQEQTEVTPEDIKGLREGIKLLSKIPSYEECIHWARQKFEKYFVNDIKSLLYTYPLDAKTKDGNNFWTFPKRPPVPITFDKQNPLHVQFVSTLAYLRAKMFGIENKNWRSEREQVAALASEMKVSTWEPSEEKKKSIADKVQKQGKDQQEEEEQQSTFEESQNLFEQFKQLKVQLQADEFEKDNDQNGHIDFIYSFGNLRANNYSLDNMDWLTVKIKAGRIVPALATTTSVVAALQTIEFIKTIKGVQLDQMKNAFVNLAIPFIQLTEPGVVPKLKIKNTEVTLWDRWDIDITKDTTLEELFKILQEKYELYPKNLFVKSAPIYMEVMISKKPQEKQELLKSSLQKLLNVENYIDVTVNFTLEEQDSEFVKGVPLIRLQMK